MTNQDNINIAAGERIKTLRGKRTQVEMALQAGVTQGQWSKFEKGIVPKIDVANKIAAVLGESIEFICYGEPFPHGTEKFRKFSDAVSGIIQTRRIPVLGRISAGFPNYAEEEILEYINHPDAPAGSCALIVKGHSMEPEIRDGDYMIFTPDGEYRPGDVLVVLNEWGEATLKRLQIKDGNSYLVPDNSNYETIKPNEHFKIIGKVVTGWRKIRV